LRAALLRTRAAPEEFMRPLRVLGVLAMAALLPACVVAPGYGPGYDYGAGYVAPPPAVVYRPPPAVVFGPAPVYRPYYGPRPYYARPYAYGPRPYRRYW
jgi:hypothetical protein